MERGRQSGAPCGGAVRVVGLAAGRVLQGSQRSHSGKEWNGSARSHHIASPSPFSAPASPLLLLSALLPARRTLESGKSKFDERAGQQALHSAVLGWIVQRPRLSASLGTGGDTGCWLTAREWLDETRCILHVALSV